MAPAPVLISVIVPSYNHAAYVQDAIASVAAQETDGSFEVELIVIDDGSTDGSVDLLKRLHAEELYPFRLVYKHNEGLCRTLNRAVREESRGAYVSILASDDMWRPDKLKVQLAMLKAARGSELCYSNAETFGIGRNRGKSSSFIFSGSVKHLLTVYNFVPAGTMMFTRRLYDRIGGFDETGLKLEDWDFLLRASAVTRFCAARDFLLLYRVHSEGSLIRMRRTGTLYTEKMKVLAKNRAITSPLLRGVSACLHFGLDRLLRPLVYRIKAIRT